MYYIGNIERMSCVTLRVLGLLERAVTFSWLCIPTCDLFETEPPMTTDGICSRSTASGQVVEVTRCRYQTKTHKPAAVSALQQKRQQQESPTGYWSHMPARPRTLGFINRNGITVSCTSQVTTMCPFRTHSIKGNKHSVWWNVILKFPVNNIQF